MIASNSPPDNIKGRYHKNFKIPGKKLFSKRQLFASATKLKSHVYVWFGKLQVFPRAHYQRAQHRGRCDTIFTNTITNGPGLNSNTLRLSFNPHPIYSFRSSLSIAASSLKFSSPGARSTPGPSLAPVSISLCCTLWFVYLVLPFA